MEWIAGSSPAMTTCLSLIYRISFGLIGQNSPVARSSTESSPAATPKEGDWPKATGDGRAAWADEIDALVGAHNALVHELQKFTEAELNEPTRDPRNRKTGAGVTRYVLLHGLVQHHAYHAGQISLLAKI